MKEISIIDPSVQSNGLGGDLLLATGEHALLAAAEVGGVAIAIDAKNGNAARWDEGVGALALLDDPLNLVLPLHVVAAAIAATGKCQRLS